MNNIVQALIDQGIDPSIAESMAKVMDKAEKKPKKKFYGEYTKRELINVPIVVHQTCLTCKTETTFKRVMQVYSDETDREQNVTISLCVNCIRMFELMSKQQLISLLIIQNHPDLELRMFSTATQIKLAGKKSAKDWLTTRIDHTVDKDDE